MVCFMMKRTLCELQVPELANSDEKRICDSFYLSDCAALWGGDLLKTIECLGWWSSFSLLSASLDEWLGEIGSNCMGHQLQKLEPPSPGVRHFCFSWLLEGLVFEYV